MPRAGTPAAPPLPPPPPPAPAPPSKAPPPATPAGVPVTPATRPAAPPAGSVGAPASESPAPEWAVQALDKVDDLVAKVRANTTERLVRVARIVVFGLLAAIMGTTAGVLAVIGLVRGLDEMLPGPVWGVYLLLGAIFTAAGAFLWAKKTPRPANT